MIELVVNIPDTKQKLVEELIAELGGEVIMIHREKHHKSIAKKPGSGGSAKMKTGKASDHTFLFDKWKDFDIDIAKIREEAW